ncbi:hypothetical protein F2P56_020193 [Juglans regia]|uniref:Uncharacterized protein n=1 Tax=Juglans regia TaxID=51240 RepID=A0A833X4W4_JUGRE|nr:hypothetical protein F2P56_020193 [Juglans regia]
MHDAPKTRFQREFKKNRGKKRKKKKRTDSTEDRNLFFVIEILVVFYFFLNRLGFTVTATGHGFGDRRQLLQIQPHHGVRKHTRVFLGVPLRHVHYVRFQNQSPGLPVAVEPVHRRDRPVILQPVLPSDNTEPCDVPLVVQYIQPLGAGSRRKPGDDIHVPGAPDDHTEVVLHRAALDEVLVGMGFVEAPNDGPDGVGRRVYALRHQGGALAGPEPVGVELDHEPLQLVKLVLGQPGWDRQVVGRFVRFFMLRHR